MGTLSRWLWTTMHSPEINKNVILKHVKKWYWGYKNKLRCVSAIFVLYNLGLRLTGSVSNKQGCVGTNIRFAKMWLCSKYNVFKLVIISCLHLAHLIYDNMFVVSSFWRLLYYKIAMHKHNHTKLNTWLHFFYYYVVVPILCLL